MYTCIIHSFINLFIMFILRKITGDGVEMNFALGNSYVLTDHESSSKDFKKLIESDEYYKSERENIYGFITEQSTDIHCLFKNQKNYIMYHGNTVDNVSFK